MIRKKGLKQLKEIEDLKENGSVRRACNLAWGLYQKAIGTDRMIEVRAKKLWEELASAPER